MSTWKFESVHRHALISPLWGTVCACEGTSGEETQKQCEALTRVEPKWCGSPSMGHRVLEPHLHGSPLLEQSVVCEETHPVMFGLCGSVWSPQSLETKQG